MADDPPPTEEPAHEPLIELLRKAHRHELLPVARALGLRHERMGRGTLVAAIDGRLRRSATNDLANVLLRRGQGLPYPEVLQHLVRYRRLTAPPSEVEALEEALLHSALEARWAELSPEERAERWEAMGAEQPAPEDSAQAIAQVQALHGERSPLTLHTLLATRLLPGPLGCLPALFAMAPRLHITQAAVLEVGRLRKAVRFRVTVGIVGSPSSGKDAAMNAVFGIDTGNIHPVAGSTKTVEIVQLPEAHALYLVNTPGLGDVVEDITEAARQVLDHIDLYVYVVNAQGGVQSREKADHTALLATGRPVLSVVNKIDTLREEDRDRYLDDARDKLGVPPADFAAVAFDPLPQLADAPIGIERVQDWIEQRLVELGKSVEELPWRHATAPAPVVENPPPSKA